MRTLFDDGFIDDRQALLRAVLDEPDELGPRLVFADWLEERGDSRGELIRVQCALEAAAEFDLGRRDWELRARQLLQAHGREWAQPVANVATTYRFRRGFVEQAACGAKKFLSQGHLIYERHPVCEVRLTRLGTSSVRGADLARSSLLSRLRGLELVGQLTVDELSTLLQSPHLQSLRRLRVDGPGFPAAGLAPALQGQLLELEELDVRWQRLPSSGPLALPPSLRQLSVRSAGWRRDAIRWLGQSPQVEGLSRLSLRDNTLNVAGGQALAEFPCRRLQSLDLSSTAIRGGGVQALADSPVLDSVRELNLNGNAMGRRGFQALVDSPRLANLRGLRLGMNHLEGVNPAHLLRAAPQLESLELRGNDLDDDAALRLAASPEAESLRRLDLSSSRLSSKGVAALVRSPHFESLQCLVLDYCRLNAPSLRALADLTNLRHLRVLSIKDGAYTNASLELLLKAERLDQLAELRLGAVAHAAPKTIRGLRERFGDALV